MNKNSKPIVFALPGNEQFALSLVKRLQAESGEVEIRSFPDNETYLKILSNVEERLAVVVCSLHHPNENLVPLYFLARNLKTLGARHIRLTAPYLAYMRQDKVFQIGEAVTSEYFADMICSFADSIVTVDPHLHRRNSLSEIYGIPNQNVHSAGNISEWINQNVDLPVLIGPDAESEQWVSEVARKVGAPFTVLEKVRIGDRDVSISIPELETYREHTPVLVDDIISTARTMIETVGHLKSLGMRPPVCVGVHAVFAGNAYRELIETGVEKIVTCNTILHESNGIDVSDLLVNWINRITSRHH